MPAEGHRVEPEIAVGHLDALGSGRGPRGVVDRRRGGFVVAVECGCTGALEQVSVGLGAEHESVVYRNVSREVVVLRVDEQRGRPRVFDDVGDFVAIESEVDRDEHASVGGDSEECDQEPTGVGGQDRDAFAGAEAEIVERNREGPSPAGKFRVGDGSESVAGWVRFVGHARPCSVDVLRSVQEIECGQRYMHRNGSPGVRAPERTRAGRSGEERRENRAASSRR